MITAHYDEIDSTNLQARRLARLNPDRAVLVSARTQSAGRGRLGRTWQSPAGGAWFSLAWPCRHGVGAYGPASLVVGLAIHKLLAAQYDLPDERLKIKWPNDLLLDDRKVGGILCEWQEAVRPTTSQGVLIVGVGLNLAIDMGVLPTEVRDRAGTLLEGGAAQGEQVEHPPDVRAFVNMAGDRLASTLAAFETSGFDDTTHAALVARLAWCGRVVRLQAGPRLLIGQLRGIDPAGRLEVVADGHVHRLDSGEILEVRAAADVTPGSEKTVPGTPGTTPTPTSTSTESDTPHRRPAIGAPQP